MFFVARERRLKLTYIITHFSAFGKGFLKVSLKISAYSATFCFALPEKNGKGEKEKSRKQ